MLIQNPNMSGKGNLPPEAQRAIVEGNMPTLKPIGREQVMELTRILQEYKAGKARVEQRIIAAENWWKLRNASEEISSSSLLRDGFVSKSGWLHNVIVQKHSDAMEAYPEPNTLMK